MSSTQQQINNNSITSADEMPSSATPTTAASAASAQQTTLPAPSVATNGCSSSCSNDDKESKEVHVDPKRYKTKMCRNFMRDGECPYDTRCMFAHGPNELRTPDENVRDGLVTESAIKKHQQQLMYEARVAMQTKTVQPPSGSSMAPPTCTCPDCCSSADQCCSADLSAAPPLSAYDEMMLYSAPPAMCRTSGGSSYGCPCPDCMYIAAQQHHQYYYGMPPAASAPAYYGQQYPAEYGYGVFAP